MDFAKAYDSLDWRYLWNVLRRRGFPEEWVRWMKLCVTASSCSVLISGQTQGGWFQPQLGLSQGCPLAPLLFILAADALAFCTMRLCSHGHLSGFQTAGHPRVYRYFSMRMPPRSSFRDQRRRPAPFPR